MTSCELRNSIFTLLVVSIFSGSCNGQTSTSQATNKINETTNTEPYPKIVHTVASKSETVNCELLDKDGNLWISISGEGVYRYDGKSFTNFTIRDGLCSNSVGPIIQDKSGNILFGTNRGICKYDGKVFINMPLTDTLSITSLLEDREGNIWIGAIGKGIYWFDGKKLSNLLYKYEHPFFGQKSENYISDILQDRNGNIWFGSWNGGGVWKYDGKSFKSFLPSLDYYKSNQDKRVRNNAQSPLNFTQNNDASNSKPFVQSQDYITDDMIFSITEDNLGNIWFATRDHGICFYNGKIFTSIGKNEGFNSRGASAILQDDKYNFWITTFESGVWYYNGKTFENFNEADGLVSNSVLSVLKDKNGSLWFGTKFLGLSRYDGKTFTTFSQPDN